MFPPPGNHGSVTASVKTFLCSADFNIFTGRNEVVAKVMFLLVSVILLTGGCLPQCMLGYQPLQSRHPLGADTPGSRHPPKQTPPRADTHPGADTPPRSRPSGADTPAQNRHPSRSRHPPGADSRIWSMSGRYASYWNAFLFQLKLLV